MRISEAVNLTLDDVDLLDGILTIRSSKFGKSRMVTLHYSTVTALADYRERRGRFLAGRQVPHWFVNRRADTSPMRYRRRNVPAIGRQAWFGWRERTATSARARSSSSICDDDAYAVVRDGQDIERRLPILSAYLGHVEIRDTYWYLSACPPFLPQPRIGWNDAGRRRR